MAVDTRDKRASAFGLNLPYAALLPNPSGSDAATAGERQHIAFSYSGIEAEIAMQNFLDADTALWWADDGYIDFSDSAKREEFWDTTNDLLRNPGSSPMLALVVP